MRTIITEYRDRFEQVVTHSLDCETLTQAPQLQAAVRYALTSGGKRLRPLLVYATGALLNLDDDVCDSLACAIEYLHTYSLVHDDLPAMDDDIERRGQPTVHIQYDEATAILVGDYLQAAAFAQVTPWPAASRILAAAAQGMVVGQSLDLQVANAVSFTEIQSIHQLKTAGVLKASILMPLHCATTVVSDERLTLEKFSDNLGRAYQIQDDLFDQHDGTLNCVVKIGEQQAQHMLAELFAQAFHCLEQFGERAVVLRELTQCIQDRTY